MSYLQQISLAQLYVEVVNQAGVKAKKTGDKGWTALFILGVAVGLAGVTVNLLERTSWMVSRDVPHEGDHP